MIWLLVIATLAAPILAIVVAEKMRERRRKRNAGKFPTTDGKEVL